MNFHANFMWKILVVIAVTKILFDWNANLFLFENWFQNMWMVCYGWSKILFTAAYHLAIYCRSKRVNVHNVYSYAALQHSSLTFALLCMSIMWQWVTVYSYIEHRLLVHGTCIFDVFTGMSDLVCVHSGAVWWIIAYLQFWAVRYWLCCI